MGEFDVRSQNTSYLNKQNLKGLGADEEADPDQKTAITYQSSRLSKTTVKTKKSAFSNRTQSIAKQSNTKLPSIQVDKEKGMFTTDVLSHRSRLSKVSGITSPKPKSIADLEREAPQISMTPKALTQQQLDHLAIQQDLLDEMIAKKAKMARDKAASKLHAQELAQKAIKALDEEDARRQRTKVDQIASLK